MSSITIRKISIVDLDTDAIVNAANDGLWAGSGVCGAIFHAAGHALLQEACDRIGHCATGSAVITPGFHLKARYIIHAVGPMWHGGDQNEPKLLYSAYRKSLELAQKNGCHSIGFPLLSAGIFGYPIDRAWRKAIQACNDFIQKNGDFSIDIVFAVLDDYIIKTGEMTVMEIAPQLCTRIATRKEHLKIGDRQVEAVYFHKPEEPNPLFYSFGSLYAAFGRKTRLFLRKRACDMKRWLALALCVSLLVTAMPDCLAEGGMILPRKMKVIDEETFAGIGAERVTVPEGVERIESRAFSDSGDLTIDLPGSLSYIAPDAFNGRGDVTAIAPADSYARSWCEENYYTQTGSDGKTKYMKVTVKDEDGTILYMHRDNVVVHDGVLTGLHPSTAHVNLPEGIHTIGSSCNAGGGATKTLSFPSTLTTVEDHAFFSSTLTSVILPDTVTSYGDKVFWHSTELQEVRLPACVTELSENEFWYCRSLTSVELPEGLKTIGKTAFFQCESLPQIQLPRGLKQIGMSAFGMCYALRSIEIPRGVKRIEQSTFGDCTSLTSVTLPEGLTYIGDYAFYGCSALESLTIPESVKSFGAEVFVDCGNLILRVHKDSAAEKYARDNGVPYVVIEEENNPWMQAPTLNYAGVDNGRVHLSWTGNGVAETYSVYELMEEGYESKQATVRGEEAYLTGVGAGEHTYLVRPVELHASAIGMASNTKTVNLIATFWPSAPEWVYADETAPNVFTLRWSGEADRFEIVEYGQDGSETVSASTTGTEVVLSGVSTGLHRYIIRAVYDDGRIAHSSARGLTAFGEAMDVILNAEEMILHVGQTEQLHTNVCPFGTLNREVAWSSSNEAVATVDENGLVTGVAPGTAVVTAAVGGKSDSCQVDVESGATTTANYLVVEDGVLVDYTGTKSSLKTLTIPDTLGIWKIGDDVFSGCHQLKSAEIPEGVQVLGEGAFAGCNMLTDISLPESLTSIGNKAFNGCSMLESLYLPDGVESIGYEAFCQCDSLAWIEIPASVTSIGSGAFYECEQLDCLLNLKNVKSFGTAIFKSCDSLDAVVSAKSYSRGDADGYPGVVVLPDTMTEIPNVMFSSCEGIRVAVLPESVSSIGFRAFEFCHAIPKIELPVGFTTLGYGAFRSCTSLSDINLEKTSLNDIGDPYDYYYEGAFSGCTSLESVILPRTLAKLPHKAFASCKNLRKALIYPETVVDCSGGRDPFGGCALLTIYGESGHEGEFDSAQHYAKLRRHPFISMEYWNEDYQQPVDTDEAPIITDENGNILMGTGMTLSDTALFGERNGMSFVSGQDSSAVSIAGLGGHTITAISPGTVTIQARVDGEYQTLTIRVVGGFEARSVVVAEEETESVGWSLVSGFTKGEVTVESANGTNVAKWNDEDGTVTGLTNTRLNKCSLRMDLGSGLFSRCQLYVMAHPENVDMNPATVLLSIGETQTLSPHVKSWEMERPYAFESDDPEVATVNRDGVVTAVGQGVALITATAYNGVEGYCEVQVLPEGYSMRDIRRNLNMFDYRMKWMLAFNLLFTDQTYTVPVVDENGNDAVKSYTGVNFKKLSDGWIQRAYATLLGTNAEYTTFFGLDGEDLRRDTAAAFYLADQVMCSLAPVEAKDISISVDDFQEALSKLSDTNTYEAFFDKLCYFFQMAISTDGENGRINLAQFDKYYSEHGPFSSDGLDWSVLTASADVYSCAKAIVEMIGKKKVYESVDPARLQMYIDAFYASECEWATMAAWLMEKYQEKGPEAWSLVSMYYGWKPCLEKAARYLDKAIRKGVKNIAYAIPVVGEVYAIVSIGASLARGINDILLDINDMQRNIFKASYAIDAADGYRLTFLNAYRDFANDPLSESAFFKFMDCYRVFGYLVASEYTAAGKVADTIDGSLYNKIKSVVAPQDNPYEVSETVTGPGGKTITITWTASWEKWALRSAHWMDDLMEHYAVYVLDVDPEDFMAHFGYEKPEDEYEEE